MSNESKRLRKARIEVYREEGREAGLAGRHSQTNPYSGTSAFVHWAGGHDEGTQEREGRLSNVGSSAALEKHTFVQATQTISDEGRDVDGGTQGVIVAIMKGGEAYAVEFDADKPTATVIIVEPHQIEVAPDDNQATLAAAASPRPRHTP